MTRTLTLLATAFALLATALSAPTAVAADTSDLPLCEEVGLVARDDIVTVAVGGTASVDLLLNDVMPEDAIGRAYLVEPLIPPAGTTVGQDPGRREITVPVSAGYSGEEYFTYRYNLVNPMVQCRRGGDVVFPSDEGTVTVHVAGIRRKPLRLRVQRIRVRPGTTRTFVMRGALPTATRIDVVGKAVRRGVSVTCARDNNCSVSATRGARGLRGLRLLATTSDGRTDVALLVVRVRV